MPHGVNKPGVEGRRLHFESCAIYELGKLLIAKHLEGSTANDASKGLHAACLLLSCLVAPATEESEDMSAVVREINR